MASSRDPSVTMIRLPRPRFRARDAPTTRASSPGTVRAALAEKAAGDLAEAPFRGSPS